MSEPIGKIIDATDGGKPAINPTVNTVDGNKSGVSDGKIIAGYESDEPRTERFDAGIGSAGNTRRTRFGGIDRRTKAGRSASGIDSGATAGAKEQVHLSSISIADMLFSLHLMGKEILHTPELEISKEEATKLSDAIQEVGKHYNVSFDPKKVAIFNLAMVAGGIYGTRLVAFKMRLTQNRPVAVPTPIRQSTPVQHRTTSATAVSTPDGMVAPSDLFGFQSAELI